MSRVMLRSMQALRTPLARLAPASVFPSRALSTTGSATAPAAAEPVAPTTPTPTVPASLDPFEKFAPRRMTKKSVPTAPPKAKAEESIRTLLPLLRAQPNHYISTHIHGKRYLVTQGDHIRLPFKMPGVVPGDVLRLDRASVLGSRDFTLKGSPWIDTNLFECRATVLGTESEPMRIKIKKKQRDRRSQQVFSKHKYTILCVNEIKILDPN